MGNPQARGLKPGPTEPRYSLLPLPAPLPDRPGIPWATAGGSIAGYFRSDTQGQNTPGGVENVCVWAPDRSVRRLETIPRGWITHPTAVTPDGVVVGYALGPRAERWSKPILWRGGVPQSLPTLGGDFNEASGINRHGVAVGYSTTTGRRSAAVIWESGQIRLLPPADGDDAAYAADAINDHGVIVGSGPSGLVVWEQGRPRALGVRGRARAINNAGWIVGTTTDDDDAQVATLWRDGQNIFLDCLIGDEGSVACGINDRGWVVGYSYKGDSGQGVLWQDGQISIVDNLIQASTGWNISSAQFIDEKGAIGAFGTGPGGFGACILESL